MATKAEFAAQLKTKYPSLAGHDDNQLVDKWMQSHPDDAKLISDSSEAEPSFSPVAFGLRVIPPTLIPAAGPIGSAVAGGSEALAQAYEYLTQGSAARPGQIAAQAALGAIPFAGPVKTASRLRSVIGQGVKGAALGATSRAVTDIAAGKDPTFTDVGESALLGGALGGGVAAYATKGASKAAKAFATTPDLDALNKARQPSVKSHLPDSRELMLGAKEKYLDELARPKKLVKDLTEQHNIPLTPDTDPRITAEIELGGKAYGRSEVGKMDIDEIVKGTRKSINPTTNKPEDLVDDVRNYLDLLGSKGAGENLERRLRLASPEEYANAKKGVDRLQAGEALPVGYTPAKVDADLQEIERQLGPDRFTRVKAEAQKVLDFNHDTLKVYHDAGIIRPEAFQELSSRGGHVHMNRILDDATSEFNSRLPANLSKAVGMEKLVGSKRATIDPFEAALMRRQVAEFAAAQNRASLAFTEFRNHDPALASTIFELKSDAKPPAGFGEVTNFLNGKKQRIAMPEQVADALKMTNEDNAKTLGHSVISFLSRMTSKAATTSNAAFALTNPIRDVTEKVMFSKEIKNPVDLASYMGEWVKTLAETIKNPNNPARREFLQSGAAFGTKQKSLTPEGFLKGGKPNLYNPFSLLEQFSNLTEEATKLSSFKYLAKKGVAGQEQVIRTRRTGGSPDFGVKGSKAKTMNSLMLFFNANMQGLARNLRGIRDMGPARMAGTLAGVTAGEMLRNEWNSQFVDSDGVPAADRITDNDRELYWSWVSPETEKIGGVERHKVYKITKAHAMRMISNPISSVIEMSHGKGNGAKAATDLAEQFIPGSFNLDASSGRNLISSAARGAAASMTPVLKQPMEQYGNKEFFSNVPIIPKRLEGLPPGMQSTADTPAVYKKIGEATNISPVRMASAVRAFLPGSVGETMSEVGNTVVGDPKASIAKTLTSPIVRRFVGSDGDQVQRDMQKTFYDTLEKTREVVKAYNLMRKEDPKKAALYASENRAILERRGALEKIASHLSQLRRLPDERSGPEENRILKRAMEILKQKEGS